MTAILELFSLGGELAKLWITGSEEDKAHAQAAADAAIASLKATRQQTADAHAARVADAQAAIDAVKG